MASTRSRRRRGDRRRPVGSTGGGGSVGAVTLPTVTREAPPDHGAGGRTGGGAVPRIVRVRTVLLMSGEPVALGSDAPRVVFGEEEKAAGAWAGRRTLQLDGQPAFELSFWCGTCQLLFRRLEGANETVSMAELQATLDDGLDHLDDLVVMSFAALLDRGAYLPILSEVTPRLQAPGGRGLLREEQTDTGGWTPSGACPCTRGRRTTARSRPGRRWGPPVRVRRADGAADLERRRPRQPLRRPAARGLAPTAVAVAVLDICEPAVDEGTDHYEHWGLTHFLLDGHHKFEAAAGIGRPLRLLSLVSVGASLATPEQVARIPSLLSAPPRRRPRP